MRFGNQPPRSLTVTREEPPVGSLDGMHEVAVAMAAVEEVARPVPGREHDLLAAGKLPVTSSRDESDVDRFQGRDVCKLLSVRSVRRSPSVGSGLPSVEKSRHRNAVSGAAPDGRGWVQPKSSAKAFAGTSRAAPSGAIWVGRAPPQFVSLT